MLRRVYAVLVGAHGLFQLFGAAVAFQLLDAERLYESLLLGGHVELAATGGWLVGASLLLTGVLFVVAAVAVGLGRPWALPLVAITLIASLLVTGLAERSASGVIVNVVLIVGAWQLWRSEPAWTFRR